MRTATSVRVDTNNSCVYQPSSPPFPPFCSSFPPLLSLILSLLPSTFPFPSLLSPFPPLPVYPSLVNESEAMSSVLGGRSRGRAAVPPRGRRRSSKDDDLWMPQGMKDRQ